ncbi:hypothetical protein [Candidatus Chloroploca sp. Khr17]|uniref:hypothetical protein n=1 Tax=Candidatus Chloroploca sp. Khr17 TaxID=2496869 RepID=UPI0013EC8BFE|nr:hypothetical protein [Candidatus Chloroploca sp. Khr17]
MLDVIEYDGHSKHASRVSPNDKEESDVMSDSATVILINHVGMGEAEPASK